MKREQIIEMAKACGFAKPSVSIDLNGKARTVLVFRAERLEAFAALVADHAFEDAAKKVGELDCAHRCGVGAEIMFAIRALKGKP